MKNETLLQRAQKVNLAKCSKGRQAIMVCFSQHCKNKAFICNDENCSCRIPHSYCLEVTIDKIQKIILANTYSLEPLEQKIEAVFNEAIDKLSDEKDKVLKEIQDKYHYFGLNSSERKFIEVLKKGANDQQINCEFVWKIQNQLKGSKQVRQNLTEMEKEIKKIGEECQIELNKFSSKFISFLQKVKSIEGGIFFNSKIVNSMEDQVKLLAFFTKKKVQSAKLLYRASQNQFLVSKFHQKCDYISCTLVICKTQFDKIIGGFTIYPWYRHSSSNYVSAENDLDQHFIFSLTNNDKFTITQNPQKCIYLCGDDTYGPCFGGGHDLCISNKANEKNSYANINYTYTNGKYLYGDVYSLQKFVGAKYLKLKQWQVWKIDFKR